MEKNKVVPTSIRLDEKLLNKVKELAIKNKRSVTAQIEYMLEKYIEIQEKLYALFLFKYIFLWQNIRPGRIFNAASG